MNALKLLPLVTLLAACSGGYTGGADADPTADAVVSAQTSEPAAPPVDVVATEAAPGNQPDAVQPKPEPVAAPADAGAPKAEPIPPVADAAPAPVPAAEPTPAPAPVPVDPNGTACTPYSYDQECPDGYLCNGEAAGSVCRAVAAMTASVADDGAANVLGAKGCASGYMVACRAEPCAAETVCRTAPSYAKPHGSVCTRSEDCASHFCANYSHTDSPAYGFCEDTSYGGCLFIDGVCVD